MGKFATGQFTKSVRPEITFNCQSLCVVRLFLFILSISPLYFFFYFHDLAKETYNWKMSRRVQRKALKFECDQLKKVFTKIPSTSNSTSSCNFRLAVFPCSIFHIHSKTQEKQWVRQISFTDRLICQVYNTIL